MKERFDNSKWHRRWLRHTLLLMVGMAAGALLTWCSQPRHRRSGEGCCLNYDEVVDSVTVVEVVYDTIRYREVEPQAVVALPPSTQGDEDKSQPSDSLYFFRDTLSGRWCAEVLGSNVSLRSLTLLDRDETTTTRVRYTPQWEVSLKGGLAPRAQWLGVGVSRRIGRTTITLDGGYDIGHREPYVGLSASFRLWSE